MRQKYLLDTNAAIAIINENPPSVRKRLRKALKKHDVLISSISVYELWYGVARSSSVQKNTERLGAFMSGAVISVAFEDEDAQAAGEIRAALEAAGSPIGPYDTLIAGQALRIGATLVTANIREFKRVKDLAWENWAES
ncbi:MAG TPA: type II toxin-antitoxin system VapC family toxin [Hyphomicrobiales bacterium]|nr:type II toxin-antitoxin system VapC family toxin [Hyphomicrobiales bacterium]